MPVNNVTPRRLLRSWSRPQRLVPILAMMLVVTLAVIAIGRPVLDRWQSRETALRLAREELARLQTVVGSRAAMDSAANARAELLDRQTRRVLRARSRSLAASALQSMVQDIADRSNVVLTRLEVAEAGGTDSVIPLTFGANGDIHGLASLLEQLRKSERLMTVDRLTVQVNSALRGAPDVLQITLTMHAPVIVE